jgi:hypothetical protein
METQRLIAHRFESIDDASLDRVCQASDRIGRVLGAMVKSLQTKLPVPRP